jgi:hypothetical protein
MLLTAVGICARGGINQGILMQTIRTDRAREAFVSTLAATCNVSEACRAARISRTAAYAWRQEDDAFAAAWQEAEDEAADKLEQVAYERATSGQSDKMLEILLKAHRPEKYVERQRIEHSGEIATEIKLVGVRPGDIG